jgi:uncharacterized protein (TIGR00375 family)
MLINADLHIHSRYSGATSDKMTIAALSVEAPKKGISVLATGDCLHAAWQNEIKTCTVIDDGTFEMNKTKFILSTEVEDNHRVHHLLYFPRFSAVDAFKESVKSKSKNLDTDGRPNINMNGLELASLAKDVDALIGPAHAFTPWTALYAYYPSLEACYGDLTPYISFVELGLSADTDYADTIQELHRLTFLTNSDSHSPHPVRLAREFTRFEVREPTFQEIKKAILRIGGNKPVLNVGLPPQEGKYNESACISCFTHYSLDEAIKRRWKCSCGKRIKKGVRDRIREIAIYPQPRHPDHRPPYIHLIPLSEIIAKALDQHTPFTQSVTKYWDELVSRFGSEITVLLDADIKEVAQATIPVIVDAIQAFRDHKVVIIPGGGGKYGTIELPSEEKTNPVFLGPKNSQTSLLDY